MCQRRRTCGPPSCATMASRTQRCALNPKPGVPEKLAAGLPPRGSSWYTVHSAAHPQMLLSKSVGLFKLPVPSMQVARLTDMYKKTQPVRIYAEEEEDEQEKK